VLTPNLLEAQVLLGATIGTLPEQREAARALGQLGPRMVIVKGGHPTTDTGDEAVDVAWDGHRLRELRAIRLRTANTHGTGCTFAAAIAAGLALGADVGAAVDRAKAYVVRSSPAVRAGGSAAGTGRWTTSGGQPERRHPCGPPGRYWNWSSSWAKR